MSASNTKAGILLMIATTLVFSFQDVMSRHLAGAYNIWMVVMIRYWFFAMFVMALTLRRPNGLRLAAQTNMPWIQIARGLLLAGEILVMVKAFTLLGVIETHAVFAMSPLLVTAFSGPILGEKVGWRRWLAIGVGFIGVLIILQPGSGVFNINALIPFTAAAMFALYSLLTRYVGREDSSETSFFWAGMVGLVVTTAVGIWHWEPMSPVDWGWMLLLCVFAALAHWMLIRCYEVAEASAVQPFSYFQLVFVSILGVMLFGETLRTNVVIGAVIVVSAGIFTLIRSRIVAMRAARGG